MALVHKHLIVRAEVLDPPKDPSWAESWVKELVEKIGMKIMLGPYAKYSTMVGNRGLTVVSIIETSHVVLHSWDESSPGLIQLDVYTCGPFTPEIIFEELKVFGPIKVEYKYLDREHNLTEVEL